MSKHVLGIDVSKLELSVTLAANQKFKHKTFTNNLNGHQALSKWLDEQKLEDIEVYLEATGRYGCDVTDFLYNSGYIVKVINPLKINAFAKAMLARHKTDKVDSKIIAEYGMQFDAISYKPIPEERKKLRDLYRCSQDIKDQITVCTNHLENKKNLPTTVAEFWNKTKAHYVQELKEIEIAMQDIIEWDSSLSKDRDNLLSVVGLGLTTVIAILAEIPNFKDFTSARQLAAFLGLTPRHSESGSSIYKRPRISKMGSSILRKALFFPAISAMNHNEYFRDIAKRLEQKGKAKKSIVCAIMRRLVHVIFGILKNGESFDIEKLIRLDVQNKNLASAQPVIAL